jgi:hypothetical protein
LDFGFLFGLGVVLGFVVGFFALGFSTFGFAVAVGLGLVVDDLGLRVLATSRLESTFLVLLLVVVALPLSDAEALCRILSLFPLLD